ncbi:unnamed protein product [[Candida] boidinii]|nr:hypothetical protein B5S33_g1406 [[Candida] boidinii]GME86567.1 unnamed protein product [[Candida] boidinii]
MSSDQFTSVQWDRDEPEFSHEVETIEESNETNSDTTDTQNTNDNNIEPIIESNEDDSQTAAGDTDNNKDTGDNSTVKSITSINENQNETRDNKDKIDALTDDKHDQSDKHISNEAIDAIDQDDDEMDKSQPDLLATETSNFSLITSSLNPLDTTITEETSPSTATPAAATGTAHQENSTDQGIGQQAYIIDDDFSNIHQQQQQQHIESDDHDSNYFIETSVSSPITDYEGQNPFVSYLIRTKTNNPKFKSKFFQVRRRYSDFNFLFECLSNDFPAVIIPPLPNKQRLEYIKGGRFTEEFTNKRAISLNNFLSRICEHPILSRTHLFHTFLENSDYWNTIKSNLKIIGGGDNNNSNKNGNKNGNKNSIDASQNLETVSDYIMNAFKKPNFESKNSKEFQEIYDKSTKLQENLNKVDIIYSKVLKRQNDLADDFSRFSDEFSKLTILLDSDFNLRPDSEINKNSTNNSNNSVNNDKKLKNLSTNKSSSSSELKSHQIISKKFGLFSDNLKKFSDRSHALNHQIEYNYLTSLRDLEHYITSLKNILKLKDAKSLDYEMLSNYLEKAEQERTYLMNGGSITSTTEGALSFLSRKFESLTTGHSSITSSGNLTNERIEKLNSRIEMLKKEKQNSLDLFNKFEIQVLKEYSYFEKIKNDEINNSLRQLSDSYLEYYTNLLNDWNNLDIDIDQNEFSKLSVNKLSNDSELFGENDVLKNQDILNQDISKLTQKLSDSISSNNNNNNNNNNNGNGNDDNVTIEPETETDL